MLADQHSVSVNALLAYAAGASSWRIATPSPILDASTWRVTGVLTSKYLSIAVEDIACLMKLNCFSCEGVQLNCISFFVNALGGSWRSDSPQMNLLRQVNIPIISCISCRHEDAGIAHVASTLAGSGLMPFLSYRHPKNMTDSAFSEHLSGLNMRPLSWALTMSFLVLFSCMLLLSQSMDNYVIWNWYYSFEAFWDLVHLGLGCILAVNRTIWHN